MKKIMLILMFVLVNKATSQIAVIDFEELSSLGSSWGSLNSQEYITQGFKLITDADSFKYATFYGANHIGLSVGENAGFVQLENIDNYLFEVQKISFLSNTILNVSIIGEKSDSTNIQYDIITTGNWQINEYILSDFDNLLSFSWYCYPNLGFDNIFIVPEPTSFLLFIIGTILLVRNKNR